VISLVVDTVGEVWNTGVNATSNKVTIEIDQVDLYITWNCNIFVPD
jgi:hypothetical protein